MRSAHGYLNWGKRKKRKGEKKEDEVFRRRARRCGGERHKDIARRDGREKKKKRKANTVGIFSSPVRKGDSSYSTSREGRKKKNTQFGPRACRCARKKKNTPRSIRA